MSQGAVGGRRKANERVRQLVGTFGDEQQQPRHQWMFFCECGDPHCEEMVHLSAHAFDSIAATREQRVLAEGHLLVRSLTERRRSAAFRDSAHALQRQTEQDSRNTTQLRHTVHFRFELAQDEMLDAAEDLDRLLVESEELELAPSCRDLLFALEEAIADAPLSSGPLAQSEARKLPFTLKRPAFGPTAAAMSDQLRPSLDYSPRARDALTHDDTELSDLLADVNARVHVLREQLGRGDGRWDVRCECGEEDCAAAMSLSLPEYRQYRDRGRPILADGHMQSRAPSARERANALRAEADALRQQARHQFERADTNLVPASQRRHQFVCDGCGYGISVERPPERCPMCSQQTWSPRSPARR